MFSFNSKCISILSIEHHFCTNCKNYLSQVTNIDFEQKSSSESDTCYQHDKIQYFQGDYDDFVQQFLITNRPCIVPNAVKQWKSSEQWVQANKPNIDYLSAQYGNAEVTVANCDQKYYNSQLKTTVKFADFARYWKNLMQNNYLATEPLLYLKAYVKMNNISTCIVMHQVVRTYLTSFYIHSGLALGPDWHFTKDFPDEQVYQVPQEFCSDWLNEYYEAHENLNDDYRFVYMGPKGSWTPFHVDVFTSYSWSVNICGEKKWILLPPGEEDKLKDKYGNLPYDVSYLADENNNKNSDVKSIVIIQKVGDAMFVPSGWHHQVWNTLDTISINHNWVNAYNICNMWRSMKTNFEEVKTEIQHLKEGMDDWENHCQLLLKSCFGMDFQDFFNFLNYILHRRKYSLQSDKELEVFGKWKLNRYEMRNLNCFHPIHPFYKEVLEVKCESFMNELCYRDVVQIANPVHSSFVLIRSRSQSDNKHADVVNDDGLILAQKNNELILKSIEDAKLQLLKVEKTYEDIKIEYENLTNVIETLKLEELLLRNSIDNKRRKMETQLKSEYQKVIAETEDVLWQKHLITLKIQNEDNRRKYYRNIMQNFKPETTRFLDVDEYYSKKSEEKEKEELINKIEKLNKKLIEKKEENVNSNENEILQMVQKNPSSKLKMLNKSLLKIGMLIEAKEAEL